MQDSNSRAVTDAWIQRPENPKKSLKKTGSNQDEGDGDLIYKNTDVSLQLF